MRYSKCSKGYVFIVDLENENLTEIKSQDVTFLKNNYSNKVKVKEGEPIYELLN